KAETQLTRASPAEVALAESTLAQVRGPLLGRGRRRSASSPTGPMTESVARAATPAQHRAAGSVSSSCVTTDTIVLTNRRRCTVRLPHSGFVQVVFPECGHERQLGSDEGVCGNWGGRSN